MIKIRYESTPNTCNSCGFTIEEPIHIIAENGFLTHIYLCRKCFIKFKEEIHNLEWRESHGRTFIRKD